jgi:hypothetical protein
MENKINETLLNTLIAEVEPLWRAVPAGNMARLAIQDGYFEEAGLRITHDDYPLGQYYVGLAVLVRDMHRYLETHPRDDSTLFHDVVTAVHTDDAARYGSDAAFPNYGGRLANEAEALPVGMAAAADQGHPTLKALSNNPSIVHEWTFKPGKRLFNHFLQKFGREFKEVICGDGGPYQQVMKDDGLLGQANLPNVIAGTLLTGVFGGATFWAPLAVYIAILLVKTGLKTFCEPD